MLISLCLILAIYRSKVICSHMVGILLANLALVGVVSFWTDIATELEKEVMVRSMLLGDIGCHFLVNLSMVVKTEFHFIMILLGLDRILVIERKVFYEGKFIHKVFISIVTWCLAFTLAVIVYPITGGRHIQFQPLDHDKCFKAACYILPTHPSFNAETYITTMTIIIPTLLLVLVIATLCGLWFRAARGGCNIAPEEKPIHITYLSSAGILVVGNFIELSVTHFVMLSLTLWLIIQPIVLVCWLTLEPDLRQALRRGIRSEDEGVILLESEQPRPVDPVETQA